MKLIILCLFFVVSAEDYVKPIGTHREAGPSDAVYPVRPSSSKHHPHSTRPLNSLPPVPSPSTTGSVHPSPTKPIPSSTTRPGKDGTPSSKPNKARIDVKKIQTEIQKIIKALSEISRALPSKRGKE